MTYSRFIGSFLFHLGLPVVAQCTNYGLTSYPEVLLMIAHGTDSRSSFPTTQAAFPASQGKEYIAFAPSTMSIGFIYQEGQQDSVSQAAKWSLYPFSYALAGQQPDVF